MPNKHKTFISYHHANDEFYKNEFKRLFVDIHDVIVPWDEVVERLLKMRIKWSSTLICLIGPKTHTREWVNDEIQWAHEQGKTIVGIYSHGSMETAEIPENLKKYASSIIGWNSIEKLGEIITGENVPAENPDGTFASPLNPRTTIKCP